MPSLKRPMSVLEDLVLEQDKLMEDVQKEPSINVPESMKDPEDEDVYGGKTVSLFSDRIDREGRIRRKEMSDILEAMKVRRRIEGIVQGVNINDGDDRSRFGVYFILFYGASGYQILIPAEEFYVEIPMHPKKYNNADEEISQREWCIQESKAFIGAPIDYLITRPVGDVLMASRIRAMRQKELYYYFDPTNERLIKKGDRTDARVEAVIRDHLKVDIAGIQVEIDMEAMGYQFVFDARKEYQIGMCFQVKIMELTLDTEHKKVSTLIASRKDLPEVRRELERKMKRMTVGSVQRGDVVYKKRATEDKKGFYIVSFYNETMRSLQSGRDSEAWLCDCRCEIPKSFAPVVGERVYVKITRFDEENLRLYGIFR